MAQNPVFVIAAGIVGLSAAILALYIKKALHRATLRETRMAEKPTVFVVGAGVVGLSTAIRAQEEGYNVVLLADVFPTDPKTVKYTSFWAGAIQRIGRTLSTEQGRQLQQATRAKLHALMEADPDIPIKKTPLVDYTEIEEVDKRKGNSEIRTIYPDFRILEKSELPKGVVDGATFTTDIIDTPRYVRYLLDKFLAADGFAFRARLASLSDTASALTKTVFEPFEQTATAPLAPPSDPIALINCTGLGALSLGDVLDKNMYPTRGETVLVRAPWIDQALVYLHANADGKVSYIIPRQSGDVVLGGTFQEGDWHPSSRPETVKTIKESTLALCPELLPPDKRTGGKPDINDLDVVAECVGLRPSRHGGVRIEAEVLTVDGREIPVVHNYGHGGEGFETSWGTADVAVKLLNEALAKQKERLAK
ncbi:D-amino-acid oxidase [Mycena crocata]|nr:D-amino-acid oxidase [Mycena crocata]